MGDVKQGKCGRRNCPNKAAPTMWVWVTADRHDYQTWLCQKHADDLGVGPGDHLG